jgi:hypothetical protein
MDATRAARRRRWLPPLPLLTALVTLAGGILVGLTAAGGVCNAVVAGWLLWWVRSGRGGPPPRH